MKIVKYPAKILMEPARKVDFITLDILSLAGEMLYTMDKEGAIGLAAPQVNHDIQLFVVDTRMVEPNGILEFFINPVITKKEGTNSIEEGCLSFSKDKRVRVPRANKITVEYTGLDKKRKTLELEGVTAICVQHEFDHLQGVCFNAYN